LIATSNKKYRAATGSNRWAPAVTTKDSGEPALPTAYQAIIKKMDSLEGAVKGYQLERSGGDATNPHADKTCFKCHKKGHIKPNCTETGPSASDKAWMTVPPTGTDLTLTKGPKTWKWCTTCKRWMFHHADKHEAWKIRKQGTTVVASLAVVTPDDDDDDDDDDDPSADAEGGTDFGTSGYGWGLSRQLM
jgi:hypothetical protein